VFVAEAGARFGDAAGSTDTPNATRSPVIRVKATRRVTVTRQE
jgi:hypothetical protein